MESSKTVPEILLTIAEGLSHTFALKAIAILSDQNNDLYHWIGNRDTALRLRERVDACALVREAEGTIETIGATDVDLADVRFVAVYPVLTPKGPENFIIAIAGIDSRERDAAWALLQTLAREAASELLVQINAPSIHAVLQDTPVGVSIASMLVADTPLVYVNPGFERLTGYARAEVTGRNCRFLQKGDANKRQRRIVRDALAAGQGCTVELENFRKDGRRFVNRLNLRPVYAGHTQPSYYIGFQTDVTALRQAERAKEAILDASPVALLAVDRNGSILRANSHAEKLFGYAGGALNGCSVEMLIPPPMREGHAELRAGFHRSPGSREMGPGRELRGLREDGTQFPIEVGLAPYSDGDETFVVAAIVDVTHRNELEASLRKAKEEAERARLVQASFFANVSHELKTPLNAIIGFSDILKTKLPGTVIGHNELDYAKDINESGQLLLRSIEQLLLSAKISAREFEIDPNLLDVARLLRQAVQQITLSSEKKKLDLRVEIQPDLPFLWADERSFREMLAQILSNATKFISAGGRIDVEARAMGNSNICICVTDTGPGMDDDEKRRALEPFGQVEDIYTRREGGGLGLGLSVVDSLVRLHQGRLEIDTEKGRGTTVRIVMPTHRVRESAA